MEARSPNGTVSLINDIISKAVDLGASDVHLEPNSSNIRVRYRVDGILQNGVVIHKSMQPHLSARIKIISDLDISEQRIPQDGRAFVNILGNEYDIRTSVIPTIHGEKSVLRLLKRHRAGLKLEELGMNDDEMQLYKKIISLPQGLILVCGPTGCGKTTTLYSSIEHINHDSINVITIEDPIEYQISGANQIPVNNKTGLTFAKGLRGVLRQDPDVIMIGEIRDKETAGIAIQAAMTGHLVFSTLHTNDAISAVTRLLNMEIEPFLIANTLKCVLSQRLVRKLCSCQGNGCKSCNQAGYKGRMGIFEILPITEYVREAIQKDLSTREIKSLIKYRSMQENAEELIKNKITTKEEVFRCIHFEP